MDKYLKKGKMKEIGLEEYAKEEVVMPLFE